MIKHTPNRRWIAQETSQRVGRVLFRIGFRHHVIFGRSHAGTHGARNHGDAGGPKTTRKTTGQPRRGPPAFRNSFLRRFRTH